MTMDPMGNLGIDDMAVKRHEIAADQRHAERDETKRAEADAGLDLFSCTACGARVPDAQRRHCDECGKWLCSGCAVRDDDEGTFCGPNCQVKFYRGLIDDAKNYAAKVEEYYTLRIEQIEGQGK